MANDIVKYEQQFEEIRGIITMHRERALCSVNEESLLMSWAVGRIVSNRLKINEWGSKVVTQLSEYLRTKDPTLKGYSRRNIYNMVMFFEEYSSEAFNERLQGIPSFLNALQQTFHNRILAYLHDNQQLELQLKQNQDYKQQVVENIFYCEHIL